MKKGKKALQILQWVFLLMVSVAYVWRNREPSLIIGLLGGVSIAVIGGFMLYGSMLLIKKLNIKPQVYAVFSIAICLMSVTLFFSTSNGAQYEDVIVTIEAGEKNEKAKSAELWIRAWSRDGVEYSASSLDVEQMNNMNYKPEHDSYVYTNSDSSGYGRIEILFSGDGNNSIIFNKHAWCGIAKISSNVSEDVTVVDLYDTVPITYTYHVPQGSSMPWWKIAGPLVIWATVYFISIRFALLVLIQLINKIAKSLNIWLSGKIGSNEKKKRLKKAGNSVALCFAGMCLPISYLLFQFSNNPAEVSFVLLLGTCAVTAAVFLLFFITIHLVADNAYIAYFSTVLLTLFMFVSGFVRTGIISVDSLNDMADVALLLTGGIAGALIWLLTVFFRKKSFDSVITVGVGIITAMLLFFNITSAVQNYQEQESVNIESNIRTKFVMDNSEADAPNVYWFHCDGMLGFSAFEKYFGDSQNEFLEQLESRGFMVNKEANFEAGHATVAAIPSLMCPDFYDNYLLSVIESESDKAKLHNSFDGPKYSEMLRIARLNNELITAFDVSQYNTAIIAPLNWGSTGAYYPPIAETQYEASSGTISVIDTDPEAMKSARTEISSTAFFELKNFLYTLMLPMHELVEKSLPKGFTTIATIMAEEELDKKYLSDYVNDPIHIPSTQALSIALDNEEAPHFFVIPHDTAHNPFTFNENGERVNVNSMNVLDYPPQHRYAQKILIDAIDTILEKDPNAVIVVQGDHGLHGNTQEDFTAAFGEEAKAEELWNCVISAIRVPEQYQNGEEQFAASNPLNMSRYLVNRFVGKNYEYLPANEPLAP